MNLTTTITPCTRAYIEMMRGRRDNHRCHKYGWFSHLAHYCRQKEILAEKKKKSEGGVGVHKQRTLGVILTYVAITSSGVDCALKNSKGR